MCPRRPHTVLSSWCFSTYPKTFSCYSLNGALRSTDLRTGSSVLALPPAHRVPWACTSIFLALGLFLLEDGQGCAQRKWNDGNLAALLVWLPRSKVGQDPVKLSRCEPVCVHLYTCVWVPACQQSPGGGAETPWTCVLKELLGQGHS